MIVETDAVCSLPAAVELIPAATIRFLNHVVLCTDPGKNLRSVAPGTACQSPHSVRSADDDGFGQSPRVHAAVLPTYTRKNPSSTSSESRSPFMSAATNSTRSRVVLAPPLVGASNLKLPAVASPMSFDDSEAVVGRTIFFWF